ncbi:hypothetical protein ACP70R_023098 [Stipagrostis hirtigluma subsp. patula]
MSLLAAVSSRRLLPMLSLLCVSLLSAQSPSVVSSPAPLSFDVQFTQFGFDPQMVLFHQITQKNLTVDGGDPYTAHRTRQVLPRQKRKKFVPDRCDCSRIDGVMYARPAPLRGQGRGAAADEVASFKMTLCLRIHREVTKPRHGGRIGLFLFLVPYPWNAHDERTEAGLDSDCTEALLDGIIGGGGEAVVCAHVHYDSAKEVLLSTVRIGDGFCACRRRLDRGGVPREAAVGFGSTAAGDPIKLGNILTWVFHSTLESSEKGPPLMTTTTTQHQEQATSWIEGEQRLRVDHWSRNAELSLVDLRYQQVWLRNFQLTCSLSVSVGYGNAV